MLYVRIALGCLSFNTDGSRNQQSIYWVPLHGEITHLLNHWLYYYSLLFAELSPMRDHSQTAATSKKAPIILLSFISFIAAVVELSPMRDPSQTAANLQNPPPKNYSSFFHFITSIILKMSMVAIVT